LQNIRAIQNFSADDVIISMGQKKDEVKVDVYIQPTDSMKKLYMTVFER
jgi:phage tail sheath protein